MCTHFVIKIQCASRFVARLCFHMTLGVHGYRCVVLLLMYISKALSPMDVISGVYQIGVCIMLCVVYSECWLYAFQA
jgi:hypothetical protein